MIKYVTFIRACWYCHRSSTLMFLLLCWKRGYVFTALAIMVFSLWATRFQLSYVVFIVEYLSFCTISKIIFWSSETEKCLSFSFQIFEKKTKNKVIIKLNAVKCNYWIQVWGMTMNEQLTMTQWSMCFYRKIRRVKCVADGNLIFWLS